MDWKTKRRIRLYGRILFAIYLGILIYFLFLAEILGRTDVAGQAYRYNIILFREIRRFWIYRKILGWMSVWNLAGNIVGFIPFGLFLPIIHKNLSTMFRVVGLGFLMTLLIETVQLVTKTGCFDVDDLFLNTIGVWVGWLLFCLADRIRRKYYGKKEISL